MKDMAILVFAEALKRCWERLLKGSQDSNQMALLADSVKPLFFHIKMINFKLEKSVPNRIRRNAVGDQLSLLVLELLNSLW